MNLGLKSKLPSRSRTRNNKKTEEKMDRIGGLNTTKILIPKIGTSFLDIRPSQRYFHNDDFPRENFLNSNFPNVPQPILVTALGPPNCCLQRLRSEGLV